MTIASVASAPRRRRGDADEAEDGAEQGVRPVPRRPGGQTVGHRTVYASMHPEMRDIYGNGTSLDSLERTTDQINLIPDQ